MPVQQAERSMFCGCRDGQILRVERLDQPVLHPGHGDFTSAEFVGEKRPDFAGFKNGEAVAVRGVANDNVIAPVFEFIGHSLNLINAVRFVIHRHDQGELGVKRCQHGWQINFVEKINKQVGGCGAAIHDDQICLCQRGKNGVKVTPFAQIEKPRVGMKPFQRRVLVVAVNRDMGDALVFEELDEIDGEETFADAAFAIKDENQSFHWIVD